MAVDDPGGTSRSSGRQRPNFSTRSAVEDESRLDPGEFNDIPEVDSVDPFNNQTSQVPSPYEPLNSNSQPRPRKHAFTGNVFGRLFGWGEAKEENARQSISNTPLLHGSSVAIDVDKKNRTTHRHHLVPIDNSNKLGTFSGVFVPTTLNVLSILMFLRFGFILGQSGIIGMLGIYVCSAMLRPMLTDLRNAHCFVYD